MKTLRPRDAIASIGALLSATVLLLAGPSPAPAATPPVAPASASPTRTFDFEARLDGRPIGRHRFTVTEEADGARRVRSEARFDVRFLGLTLYHYDFRAEERWQGDCLQSLAADTDDDGRRHRVQARREDDRLRIRTEDGTSQVEGCVMSYAYWLPALRRQTRLLDPQTGRVEPVSTQPPAPGTIEVGARRVNAERWRLSTPQGPVDVWTGPAGDWLGLDATIKGRTLSYRLAG